MSFLWGFELKNNNDNNDCVIMQLMLLSDYSGDASLEVSDRQIWHNILKSRPNFRLCIFEISTELINYKYISWNVSEMNLRNKNNAIIGVTQNDMRWVCNRCVWRWISENRKTFLNFHVVAKKFMSFIKARFGYGKTTERNKVEWSGAEQNWIKIPFHYLSISWRKKTILSFRPN